MHRLPNNPSTILMAICVFAILSVGCGRFSQNNKTPLIPTNKTANTNDVMSYQATANTTYAVLINGTETDITKDVTNFSNNIIYVNQNALTDLFGLEKMAVSDDLKNDYEKKVSALGLTASDGKYYSYQNAEHSIVFKENSKVYVFDDVTNVFQDPVIEVNASEVSIPLMDLIFNFGYENVGSKVDGDKVIYTVGDDVNTSMGMIDGDNIETTESSVPAVETENPSTLLPDETLMQTEISNANSLTAGTETETGIDAETQPVIESEAVPESVIDSTAEQSLQTTAQ